jgi:hypothetical protein
MQGMRSKTCLALISILAIGAMLHTNDASAAPKATSKLPLPKGSTVQLLHNNGGFSVRNGLGLAGTYRCDCTGANATGTCSTTQSEGVLTCGSKGDSCTGACSMETTTGGGGKITIY